MQIESNQQRNKEPNKTKPNQTKQTNKTKKNKKQRKTKTQNNTETKQNMTRQEPLCFITQVVHTSNTHPTQFPTIDES